MAPGGADEDHRSRDRSATMDTMTRNVSTTFSGPEVNQGRVSCARAGDGIGLTLSPDFVIPDAPAPHWQVLDSTGNAYLLQRLKVAGDRENRSIAVPGYVKDVAKVRIWCAFAEVTLGEASFDRPVT
jgi:hypothetical protein